MRINPSFRLPLALALTFGLAAADAGAVRAVPQGSSPLQGAVVVRPETWTTSQIEPLDAVRGLLDGRLHLAFETMKQKEGVGRWVLLFDRVSGQPALLEGEGIPWIPGTANRLSGLDLGLDAPIAGAAVPIESAEKLARDFIDRHPDLFGAGNTNLRLLRGASGPMLDYLYFVDFELVKDGIPVEHSHVVFRMNHGNLVQIGQELVSRALDRVETRPAISLATAWDIAWAHVGGRLETDEVLEPGRLLIVPFSTAPVLAGEKVGPGDGLTYRLVHVVSFRRAGDHATWEARVDAATGEVLSFRDSNHYGQARGGTYTTDLPSASSNRPFPHVDCGGGVFADAAGIYSGNNCTSALSGTYTRVVDSCGAISLTTAVGDLNFGTSGGYDCTTPGFGGAGNTHAARTQYYNVTLIKKKALSYLPGGTAGAWLNAQLRDNVNLTGACNAFWNGSTINFYPSGSGCGNTGEIMGVSLHEWGHGMDSNDGNGGSPNNGTGETYGDISAVLQTHQGCVGGGFFGAVYGGYGDAYTTCTGIRSADYAESESGKPHFAEDFNSDVCVGCTTFACPTDISYRGPCGYEGHCESIISSEAVWDVANRDLVAWGMDTTTAWQTLDRYWYASRPTATSAYQCPTVTSTDGCSAGNLFTVFRVVDDADGNLGNGTPHASAIFAAFNRHKIGCSSVVNTDQAGACPTLATPVLTATPANNSVILNWATVASAAAYDLYRNEAGCSAGFTKIATVTAPTTTHTDTTVVNGVTYYYRMQALGSSAACRSAMSSCETFAPIPCTPPAAPTGVTAVANGTGRLDVSWNAVGGATQYRIFRSIVSGGPWTEVGVVSSALTTIADTGLYSGTTYYYVVRAFLSCESVNSAQGSGTTSGACNRPPTFAGLVGASNSLTSSCGIALNWAAGTTACGGSLTYSVYRSRSAGFTPGPSNLVASGIAGTTWTDTGIAFNTVYHYAVRAVESTGGGTDTNTVLRSALATGAATSVYTQDFESASDWTNVPGAPDNTTGDFVRNDPIAQTGNFGMMSQPENDHTPAGTQCWFTGVNAANSAGVDDVDGGEARSQSPTFNVSTFSSASLSLWRWFFNGENDDPTDYWFLEVSNNGGTSWTTIENIPGDGPNDKDGTNQTDWVEVAVRLEDYVSLTNNMRLRVRASDGPPSASNNNDPGDLIEAAIDDIVITGYASCTGCTAPSAPTGVAATPNGANRIDVSWNAVGGAASYAVFRKSGACGSGYVQVAGNVAGTSWSDTDVSGGSSYAYVVQAHSATHCESPSSVCTTATTATATGTCLVPPAFAGLASATNANNATCRINLSWSAATLACGTSAVYNVYRSTSSSFTPSAANRIAGCVSGTTWNDSSNLAYPTRYYYVVRAEDNSGSGLGPCGGNEDSNTVVRSAVPSGTATANSVIWSTDFETGTGLAGWTTGFFSGNADEWRGISTCTARSGTKVFKWGGTPNCTSNYAANKASFAEPPGNSPYGGFDIPGDATNVRLSFWHRRDFNTDDGGLFLIQVDPDPTYYLLPSSVFLTNPPNGATSAASSNPLGNNLPIWTGTNATFINTIVDLDAACTAAIGAGCAGQRIHLAFTGSSNASGAAAGWFLDDLSLTANLGTACATAGCQMVVDVTPGGTSSVVAGSDIVFEVSHTLTGGPYTYQWTRDGVDISGATGTTYAANRATAGSHTFNCKVTDTNGSCTNVTDASVSTGTWTGGSPSPKPVPDGDFVAGTAMRGAKSGSTIDATWDVSTCPASNYNLYRGAIGSWTAFTGGACGIGVTGSTSSVTMPGDSWWIIAGTAGSEVSSFGRDSAGTEHAFTGWGSGGVCPTQTTKNTTGSCP